jgi:hypothetical protein
VRLRCCRRTMDSRWVTLGRLLVSPGIAGYNRNRAIPSIAHRANGRAPDQIFFLDLNPRLVASGFEVSMNSVRAIRYRRLALAQQDRSIADLLIKLADECDRGILCTAQWHSALPSRRDEKPKAGGTEPQL